jgi:hypothetical protein
VVADLEAFLKSEEAQTEQAISEPVEQALKQEKMRLARDLPKMTSRFVPTLEKLPDLLKSFCVNSGYGF